MAERIPIVILASGAGTGFEAIAESVGSGRLSAEILALVTDQPRAGALDKARARGIRSIVAPVPGLEEGDPSPDDRRRRHEERLLAELLPLKPRFLVMAGYMRIVTPLLLKAFRSERGYCRIVNIHPALLPAFPGLDGYGQAFRYGARVAGVTIHLVEEGVDSGPICAQQAFAIDDCRTVAEVAERGRELEHRLYPETLAWVLPERFEVIRRDRRQCVCPI